MSWLLCEESRFPYTDCQYFPTDVEHDLWYNCSESLNLTVALLLSLIVEPSPMKGVKHPEPVEGCGSVKPSSFDGSTELAKLRLRMTIVVSDLSSNTAAAITRWR